ncbi:MAG: hypothetical protein GY870_18375 [archaeon]|nr:hypothetical protein [archaeon]
MPDHIYSSKITDEPPAIEISKESHRTSIAEKLVEDYLEFTESIKEWKKEIKTAEKRFETPAYILAIKARKKSNEAIKGMKDEMAKEWKDDKDRNHFTKELISTQDKRDKTIIKLNEIAKAMSPLELETITTKAGKLQVQREYSVFVNGKPIK